MGLLQGGNIQPLNDTEGGVAHDYFCPQQEGKKDGRDTPAQSIQLMRDEPRDITLRSPLCECQVVTSIVEAYDSGELQKALQDGEAGFKKWLKALGKATGRKGKRLFLPTRVALTGNMSVRLTDTH